MIVDDVHWADAESLAWLTGFAPRAEDLPMVLAIGYRPEDLSSDAAAFRRLTERQGSRPHLLAPLTPNAVGRIVRGVLGEDADEAFCRECWAVTGGNPFEVVELTAKVRERELKPQTVNTAELRELVAGAKDSGLNERLERLGTAAVRLAVSVAVLGTEATSPLAASVAGLSTVQTADVVAKLRGPDPHSRRRCRRRDPGVLPPADRHLRVPGDLRQHARRHARPGRRRGDERGAGRRDSQPASAGDAPRR